MHSDGLTVSRVRAESSRGVMRGRVVADPATQKIEIQFPDRLPAGEVTLSMAFRGKLRNDLRGLYRARSGKRRYAFTQLEAAEARRFFPCLDEPAMKARFEISVTTDAGNTVLSNSPAAKVEPLPGGLKTVHFKPTPPLSTYLLALAVGELEASAPTSCGETEIRTWHVPGKAGLSDFGLDVARETLARLEKYFDLPYPYEKLDLVAVPDFEAGAMENAGAVFFRETLLLVDPQTATAQEKKRVAEVVCHELAHMWYGNLVTMAWWDDLWLNEAFATWMAFHIVDAWKPEWRMWHDFQHYRAAALGTDALRHSHPIYAAVRTPDEATENFDVITYEKGASVVRMLERYLGPEVFRAGVRTYIRRHREGNAVASDLWQALTEAAGFDIERIIRTWIEQEGFPLLRVRRKERGDRTELHFRQERFTLGAATATDALWPIPWLGRVGTKGGRTHTVRKLITGKSGKLVIEAADPRFIYGNADESGFFRPIHHANELTRLLKHLRALSAVERLGLVGHQWAAVRAGRAPLRSYLDLAMALGDESDPDVLIGLVSALSFIEDRVARDPEVAAAFRLRVREAFGPALRNLGLDPGGEDDLASLRRAALLDLVAQVGGDAEIIAAAAARCDTYLKDSRSLDPNLADGIVHLAARDGDAALYERFAPSETPNARCEDLFSKPGADRPHPAGTLERSGRNSRRCHPLDPAAPQPGGASRDVGLHEAALAGPAQAHAGDVGHPAHRRAARTGNPSGSAGCRLLLQGASRFHRGPGGPPSARTLRSRPQLGRTGRAGTHAMGARRRRCWLGTFALYSPYDLRLASQGCRGQSRRPLRKAHLRTQ
jgi:puromycin-sensitive aminopeptidase